MKPVLLALLMSSVLTGAVAQTSSDSVTLLFRYHGSQSVPTFVPGQFNNWGPQSSPGFIQLGAASQMSFDAGLGAWTKAYTFQIHDASRAPLGDSTFQYKFYLYFGPTNGTWTPDPLNPEQNPNDNSNSVLSLGKLFWFEFYGSASGDFYTGMTLGLVHANSDTIVSIRFATAATELDSATILDVTSSYNETKRVVSFTLPSQIPKTDYFKFVAYNNHGDSVVYKKIGYTVKTSAVPAYARLGVTLPSIQSGDSTTFWIGVPGRSIVMLRVAPVGQSLATVDPIVMNKSVDGKNWWRNMSLPLGTYEYQYEFEDGKKINDPWGRMSGSGGSQFSVGAGSAGLSADNYAWSSHPYQRPPLNRLVIYEMNLGEVTGGYYGKGPGQGTFIDLIPLLGHFNDLGVNAIELMPINDYGNMGKSGFSWGYDISSHFALEPAYGTPAQFKELVDSAHARGIAIILDVVFNHLNDPGPLWQMMPNDTLNPYFKPQSVLRPNEDALFFFKDMDHWSAETQEYIYQVLKMWIDSYRVDGFRYDFTQGIGWDSNAPDKGISGWSWRIKNDYNNGIYQIAEHLPESPTLLRYSGLTGEWHDSFRDEIFSDLNPSTPRSLTNFENLVVDLGAYPGNDTPAETYVYKDRTQPVNATVDHDEPSLVHEMLAFQGVSDTSVALARDRTYGTFMFTSLGIPMLWQGMEYGEPRGWGKPGEADRLSYRPMRWDLSSTSFGKTQFQWYKTLIYQRRYNPALYDGILQKLYRYDGQRTLVWGLSDAAKSSSVMVIANLSGSDQIITNVPWLSSGTWYDIFDHTQMSVASTSIPSFAIPRYTARVFSNRSDSALQIPVSVRDDGGKRVPHEFRLANNYPNPFNPSTTLRYELPAETFVSLKVLDLLGAEVAVLVNT